MPSLKSLLPWNQAPGSAGLRVSPFAFCFFSRFEVKGSSHRDVEALCEAKRDMDEVIHLIETAPLSSAYEAMKSARDRLAEEVAIDE